MYYDLKRKNEEATLTHEHIIDSCDLFITTNFSSSKIQSRAHFFCFCFICLSFMCMCINVQ